MSKSEPSFEFSELYRENQAMVRSLLFRLCGDRDLDDLVQDSFVKAWKNRGQFRGDSKLSTWMASIALNTAKDRLKKLNGRIEMQVPLNLESSDNPEKKIIHRNLVMVGLEQLNYQERAILVLQTMQGWSLQEMAKHFGIPEGTVKSKLHYAKATMAEFLKKKGVRL